MVVARKLNRRPNEARERIIHLLAYVPMWSVDEDDIGDRLRSSVLYRNFAGVRALQRAQKYAATLKHARITLGFGSRGGWLSIERYRAELDQALVDASAELHGVIRAAQALAASLAKDAGGAA